MKYTSLLLIFLLVLGACKVDSEPINYGSDACHYCSMTIVDRQHAAEYVTKKGKPFKFDSIECMMNALREIDKSEVAMYLINVYDNPGKLSDATKATYLISPNIPSPMGENLSAFSNKQSAERVQSEQNGELYTWQDLKERFEIQ